MSFRHNGKKLEKKGTKRVKIPHYWSDRFPSVR